MADNINNCDDDDTVNSPLPINEDRLKEIKAMEEAEQRLIEDLFSTQSNTKPKIQVIQNKPTLPNKKAKKILN
jgi:hypothetical protein